jgi:hypothetical protein
MAPGITIDRRAFARPVRAGAAVRIARKAIDDEAEPVPDAHLQATRTPERLIRPVLGSRQLPHLGHRIRPTLGGWRCPVGEYEAALAVSVPGDEGSRR